MKKNKLIYIFFIYFISLTNSFSIEPDQFVQSTVDRASKLLTNNFSKDDKIKKLKIIAKETVDIKGIGFYTLGSVRKTLDKNQKQKYLVLFEKYFLKSFSSRLSEWTDPEINVISQNIINKKYTIVHSILKATNERPEVKIDWRIYTKDADNPLIRDVIIEGLSLARTQKEEFASIINSNDGNIEALFQVMDEFSKN